MSTSCKTCDGVGTVSGAKTWPGEMTPRHEKCPDCSPEPAPELSAELQGFVDDFAGGVCDATCADAFSRLVDHTALVGSGLSQVIEATKKLDSAAGKAIATVRLATNEWDEPTLEPEPVEDFAPEDTL